MVGWREQKRKMRRDVHTTMGVPAYFLVRADSTPIAITVRGPHTKQQNPIGSLPGGDQGWAEMLDSQPRLIFDRAELTAKGITLVEKAVISLEVGEAYRIGAVKPADDQWVTAEVVRLDDADATGLPVPETA